MMEIEHISKQIWKTSNMLAGALTREESPQLMLSFVFLRRIDCLIGKYAEQTKQFYQDNKDRYSDVKMASCIQSQFGDYPFHNVSGLNFNSVLISDISIDIAIEAYIQGFSDNIQEILDGMQFRSIIAKLQRQSKYIELLFRTFQDIDLSENVVDDESLFELISYLIEKMGTLSSYESTTPHSLAKLMTEMLFFHLAKNGGNVDSISIYDPVCGTGGLLGKAFFKAMSCHYNKEQIILCGQDINFKLASIAKAVALLLSNNSNCIYHGDTLYGDQLNGKSFDFILADMPLTLQRHLLSVQAIESMYSGGSLGISIPGIYDSQFLFIEHMVSKMAPSGSRLAFITNNAVLSGSTDNSGENRIRRWLFENDLVECIVSLPNRVLYPSSRVAPIYLWVLSNNKDECRKGKAQLINAYDMFISEKGYKRISDEHIAQILYYYKKNTDSHASRILSNNQFGYYEIAYSVEGDKKTKTVKFDLNTDVDSFFKTNVIPFAKGSVSIDYTSVEKGYEVDFSKYFENKENKPSLKEISSRNILPLLQTISSFNRDVDTIDKLELESEEDIKVNILNWKECPLSYLVRIVNGVTKPKEQDGNGLPLLTISYLRDHNNEVEKYKWNLSDDKIVKDSDVLLASRGSNVGEVFKGIEGIASNTLIIARTQSDEILSKYLYYLLKGYESMLRGYCKGVAVQSLDVKAMGNMKCKLPPISTQKRIVTFLEGIDDKVDLINNNLGSGVNAFSDYRQAIIEAAVNGKLKFI